MSGHVSQLVLDELASDVAAPAGAKNHVDGCPQCAARLAATRRDREASLESFGWSRTKARVTADRPSRWRELMPFIVPVAATVLFFLVASLDLTKKPTERLKGAASIDFIRDSKPLTEARPGERLKLEVGTAGNSHAVVLAVDKDRRIELLWQGKLPLGAIVTLPRDLEVTPGSVTVHAFLSPAPLDPKLVVPAMETAMRDYGGWPLDAPPPQLAGVTVATQRLYVKP